MYRLTVQYETPDDSAAFDEQYFSQHVPLCVRIPGLRASTVSKPQALGPGNGPYLVAALDFDDEATFKAALRSAEMAAVAKDVETLPAARVMFVGELTDI